MKKNLLVLLVTSFSLFAEAKDAVSTWIFVPTESQSIEEPWRIVIYDDDSVVSEKLFFGCKREYGSELTIQNGVIEIAFPELATLMVLGMGTGALTFYGGLV